MTILDKSQLSKHIADWIKNYAKQNNIQSLIVELSGEVESALVALLCRMTGIPTTCVVMPCHDISNMVLRASNFADEYDFPLLRIELDDIHNKVVDQISKLIELNSSLHCNLNANLKAAILTGLAASRRGLIIGTINRSEQHITRSYQKFGKGCADLYPLADLFRSETIELLQHLTYLYNKDSKGSAEALLQPPIYRDIWKPHTILSTQEKLKISYEELEWADREEERTKASSLLLNQTYGERTGIIVSEQDPTKHPEWFRYTARQQVVIASLHQREKQTRHKQNTVPICSIRHLNNLVK